MLRPRKRSGCVFFFMSDSGWCWWIARSFPGGSPILSYVSSLLGEARPIHSQDRALVSVSREENKSKIAMGADIGLHSRVVFAMSYIGGWVVEVGGLITRG